jgi:hypothetical protein
VLVSSTHRKKKERIKNSCSFYYYLSNYSTSILHIWKRTTTKKWIVVKHRNLRRYKLVNAFNSIHINYLSSWRRTSSLSRVVIPFSLFRLEFTFISVVFHFFSLFPGSSNRPIDCFYCWLNTDNIVIIDKIVVDIKRNKFLSIASFLKSFFNALSSSMYGMLSFYARFCGCHLVKQQPSLSSLLLLAAVTTQDRIKKH